jgi:hypothetical protein
MGRKYQITIPQEKAHLEVQLDKKVYIVGIFKAIVPYSLCS